MSKSATTLLLTAQTIPGPKISKPAVNNNYPKANYPKSEIFSDTKKILHRTNR
jgi:hypothetical protein